MDALISMPPRHGSDNRYGARLPMRPPKSVEECWRCTADRRRLYPIAIVTGGVLVGSVRVCGDCMGTITPLNPDPLTVREIA